MEDPLPGTAFPVLLAGLGTAPLVAASVLLMGLGILLSLGHGALENLSWKKLQDRLQSEDREAAIRAWLAGGNEDRLVLILEWGRLVLYVGFVFCLDRLLLRNLAQAWGVGFAGTLGFLLLFGEGLPRFVARYNAEAVLLRLRPLLMAVSVMLLPVGRMMRWLPAAVARLSGSTPETFQQERLAAEISDAAEEGERSGVLEEGEREMIENIIDLGETQAVEVMTPRTDLTTIDCDATVEVARQVAVESGYSRIPVFEGNRDQIIGILHVKDLLREENGDRGSLREILRKPLFVPETKRVGELLREFKELKTHLAIVLDEYGGTAGLVTLEDILEEIVGEIADEFDPTDRRSPIRRVDAHTIRADAKVPVHDINDALSLGLPDDAGYETLGGFVFSTLGRVPETGESFRHDGAEFKILDADSRRVHRVEITVDADHEPAG